MLGADRTWWYVSDGQREGPVSSEGLESLLVNGKLKPNSLVWQEGMKAWAPAKQIADLKPLLASLPPDLPSQSSPELPPLPATVSQESKAAIAKIPRTPLRRVTTFLTAAFLFAVWWGISTQVLINEFAYVLGQALIPLAIVGGIAWSQRKSSKPFALDLVV